jgi:hypothetical protein
MTAPLSRGARLLRGAKAAVPVLTALAVSGIAVVALRPVRRADGAT